ncbi:hypothetical protein IPZ69_33245, partial [Streptomyces olivochromogenes]|nr:hypothetical protein [Streptomyces olivochromogenes]
MKNNRACADCRTPLATAGTPNGRPAKYCSNACRQRAYRRRRYETAREPRSSPGLLDGEGAGRRGAGVFVGRHGEMAELDVLLARERVVTLIGRAGVGKTRLAFEYLAADGARFTEVHRVDTDAPHENAMTDGELLFSAISRKSAILRKEEKGDSGGVLVFLDGCERHPGARARLARRLLSRYPGIRLLLTSREPLGVPGEVPLPLGPLGLPDGGRERSADVLPDAVRLFVERARAADGGFRLGRDNLDDVVDICARVEGIPLAVELAAGWVRLLSVRDIRTALEDPST